MSNLEHLIENSLSELEKFVGSGEDVNTFNERWRESILADPNYEGVDISPENIMEICVYFLFTWCQYCDKRESFKLFHMPCTLCGNNCRVSPLEQFKARNELCKERKQMYRSDENDT